MAKQVVEWEDSRGCRHMSEAIAARADLRWAAQDVLVHAGATIANLTKLEGFNKLALSPLKNYIDLLWEEAESRQKHGEKKLPPSQYKEPM